MQQHVFNDGEQEAGGCIVKIKIPEAVASDLFVLYNLCPIYIYAV